MTIVRNEFPILNGIAPSWADIIVSIIPGGAPIIAMSDIKSISTGSHVEVGEQRAPGGRLIRRTTGSKKDEASITLYRHGYQKLLRGLKAVMPKNSKGQYVITLAHFGINVQHTPFGEIEIFEFRVKGCRILGRDLNGAEGTDADTVDVPLNPIEMVDVIDGDEMVML